MTSHESVGLPQGWQATNVESVVTFFTGGTPFLKSEYAPVGTPVLTKGDVKPFGRIEHSGRYVDTRHAIAKRYRFTESGDLLVTTRDLTTAADFLGLVATVPNDKQYLVNQGANVFRLNEKMVDSRYFVYWTSGVDYRNYIKSAVSGSTQVHIRKSDWLNAPLHLPPAGEQQQIAHILGTLDDKIELNRRMNETLEAMARAIFQSWFVDFDPVRAKASGEPADAICRRLGLTPELLAKFPDSFEDSELGDVPTGWQVCALDQVASYLNGLALQKYPAEEGASWLPVIKIAQLRAGHTLGADKASPSVPEPYVIKDGDVLFSWSGSLEVDLWCGGPGALNQHLFKVTSEEYPKWFYLLWTKFHLNTFRDIAANKATTMGHIQRKHLSEAKVLIPSSELLKEMTKTMAPLIDMVVSMRLEAASLAKARDALLPELLSGKVPVQDGGDS